MRNYIQVILFCLLVILFLFLLEPAANQADSISEEAFPIRDEDVITGIEYHVSIGRQVRKSSLEINTHVLDSIWHYKDISKIQSFTVYLFIDNQSKFSYLLKNIQVINGDRIENVSYHTDEDSIIIQLDQEFFKKYKVNDSLVLYLVK